MTLRWPSTAETCRHHLTNKYDPTTVVFWQTHPPSFTQYNIKHLRCGKKFCLLRTNALYADVQVSTPFYYTQALFNTFLP